MKQVWEQVAAGHHVVVLGEGALDGPGDESVFAVHVDCDSHRSVLGPLLEAHRRIARALGEEPEGVAELAAEQAVAGLRRRLLGEQPGVAPGSTLLSALNRLAERSAAARPACLVLEGLDEVDAHVLRTLGALLETEGRLKLPLVMTWSAREPADAAAGELIEAVRARGGAVLDAAEREASDAPVAGDETRLPDVAAEVLRVLRAGALTGATFEAELVADLLELEPLAVLEALQRAADAGVDFEDLGEGRFRLGAALAEALRASLLPSLARAWHRRLAVLLGAAEPPTPPAEGSRTRTGAGAARPAPVASEVPSAQPPTHSDATDSRAASSVSQPPPITTGSEATGARDSAPSAAPADPPDRSAASDDAPQAQARAASTRPSTAQSGTARPASREPVSRRHRVVDDARAAEHALAAGQVDAAAQHYLSAAHQAALGGLYTAALELATRGVQLVERLPRTAQRRQIRILLLAELGRIQWIASGPGAQFTLSAALRSLEQARSLLQPDDPIEIAVELAVLIASICYDAGDDASLERALRELSEASRALMDAGRPVEATRLLNDQAAVWVRLGDFPRANHLLQQSRELFEDSAEHSAEARAELAETHHLIARLTLRVAPRPGHEADAVAVGIHHARAAEEAYRELDLPREQARVKETLARLELRGNDPDAALRHLQEALAVQQRLGDVIGLARTSAAAAEVLAERGDLRQAITLLEQSLALNLEKGAAQGLEANHAMLTELVQRARTPDERRAVERLVRRLGMATGAHAP